MDKKRNISIPTQQLEDFFNSGLIEIPLELLPFVATIPLDNCIVNLHSISYCTTETSNERNQIIVFTKYPNNVSHTLVNITDKITGNLLYINDEILRQCNDTNLLGSKIIRAIANQRRLKTNQTEFIHIDKYEYDAMINELKEGNEYDIKLLNKTRGKIFYSAVKRPGVHIITEQDKNFVLRLNAFNKSKVNFKDYSDVSLDIEKINTAIEYLQVLIPNTQDLIMLCNLVLLHYENPFDTEHRRITTILHGKQGTGKNMLCDIIADLFNVSSGFANYNFNKNLRFNSELKGLAFIGLSEFRKTKDNATELKYLTGQQEIQIEAKGQDKINYPCYLLVFATTNEGTKKGEQTIYNLIESIDNRTLLVEMQTQKTKKTAGIFNYCWNSDNWSTIQLAILLIALSNKQTANAIANHTQNKNATLTIDYLDLLGKLNNLLEYVEVEIEKNNLNGDEIYIHKKIFEDLFKNNQTLFTEDNIELESIYKCIKVLNKSPEKRRNDIIVYDKESNFELKKITSQERNIYHITIQQLKTILNLPKLQAQQESKKSLIFASIKDKDTEKLQDKLHSVLTDRKSNFKFYL